MKIFERLADWSDRSTDSGPRICSARPGCAPDRPRARSCARARRSRRSCDAGTCASLCCPAVALKRILRSRPLISRPRIQRLIDRLVVGLAADVRAIELLAVEQRDRCSRTPSAALRAPAPCRRWSARIRRRREVVFDAEAAARAEGHAFEAMLLAAGAGSALRRQRDHHVGDVAVGVVSATPSGCRSLRARRRARRRCAGR